MQNFKIRKLSLYQCENLIPSLNNNQIVELSLNECEIKSIIRTDKHPLTQSSKSALQRHSRCQRHSQVLITLRTRSKWQQERERRIARLIKIINSFKIGVLSISLVQ
ncbi:Hypothetical_protein [Hexamita inflata]|uniref:Hypothetical_protein n=1 Tax=Hexamita inflata TaxID=28002 RepID=A0ABP1GHM3_9EUKA